MKHLVGLWVLLFLAIPVQAATLYIDPPTPTISRGDALKLSVRVDVDEESGECINSIEGVLQLTGPTDLIDVSTGQSIFSIWVEPPTLNENSKQITFAGGVPNGYCGRIDGDPRLTNNIFDLVLRADSVKDQDGVEQEATASFIEPTLVYLNNGFGTQIQPVTFPSTVTVLPTQAELVQDPWSAEIDNDTVAPQPFSIQLEKDRLAFAGKYYVSFNTTDKQTGVDRYEIMEEPRAQFWSFTWGRVDAPWREVRSPYVLQDQSLNSTIRIRAIDKAGNEYVATYVPDASLRTMTLEQILIFTLLGLLVFLFAAAVFVFTRKKRALRHERNQAELEEFEAQFNTPQE